MNNYTAANLKDQLEKKLLHNFGVTPENASDELFYKATTLVLMDIMRARRSDFRKTVAAEQAKSHALIEHEPQLHHMGDERHSAYRLQRLHRPQLDQLVDANQSCHSRQIKKNKCHWLPRFCYKKRRSPVKGAAFTLFIHFFMVLY